MNNKKETIKMRNKPMEHSPDSPQNDFYQSTITTPEVVVSRATFADASMLCAVHAKTRYKTDIGYHSEYARATRESGYYENFWSTAFDDDSLIILKAEQNGEILGFITVGPSPFPTSFGAGDEDAAKVIYEEVHALNPVLGELQQIYVLPDQHGKGLGATLYKAGAQALAEEGYSSMLINVIRENGKARDFYENMGSKSYGVVREDIPRDRDVYCVFCALYVDDKIDRFLDRKQDINVKHLPI